MPSGRRPKAVWFASTISSSLCANPAAMQQTFRRDGDTPRVEIHDPLKPHRDLLPIYTDREIHNLTAYLVTLK